MSRRRALLASTQSQNGGGGSKWAYELHLTPEWEVSWGVASTTIEGDFIELFEVLKTMVLTLGTYMGEYYEYELYDIPEECNITVDGYRISVLYLVRGHYYLEVSFGSNSEITGVITASSISLDK